MYDECKYVILYLFVSEHYWYLIKICLHFFSMPISFMQMYHKKKSKSLHYVHRKFSTDSGRTNERLNYGRNITRRGENTNARKTQTVGPNASVLLKRYVFFIYFNTVIKLTLNFLYFAIQNKYDIYPIS